MIIRIYRRNNTFYFKLSICDMDTGAWANKWISKEVCDALRPYVKVIEAWKKGEAYEEE